MLGDSHDVVTYMLKCNIIIDEIELKLDYYIHFQPNLRRYELLYPPLQQ